MQRQDLPRTLLPLLVAAWLQGCVGVETLRELETDYAAQRIANPCAATVSAGTSSPAHGSAWVGAPVAQLRASHGIEDLALATPSGQTALCYSNRTSAGAACLDTYLVDSCGNVQSYFCR